MVPLTIGGRISEFAASLDGADRAREGLGLPDRGSR